MEAARADHERRKSHGAIVAMCANQVKNYMSMRKTSALFDFAFLPTRPRDEEALSVAANLIDAFASTLKGEEEEVEASLACASKPNLCLLSTTTTTTTTSTLQSN